MIGLGIEGEEGLEAGAAAGAKAAGEDGIHAFSEEDAWDVIEDIPPDTAAALLFGLEHHLGRAAARYGTNAGKWFRIADGFISPLDLVEIGLLSREEAEQHARRWSRLRSPRPPAQDHSSIGGVSMMGARRSRGVRRGAPHAAASSVEGRDSTTEPCSPERGSALPSASQQNICRTIRIDVVPQTASVVPDRWIHPWHRFHFSPEPHVHGSLRPRRASSCA